MKRCPRCCSEISKIDKVCPRCGLPVAHMDEFAERFGTTADEKTENEKK